MKQLIVYRKLPGVPHRQYVKRIIDRRHVLWHRDAAVAERMSSNDAHAVACILRQRSIGKRGMTPTEPAGEYGTEEVTT